MGRVELFLFGDGHGVAAPEEYRIELWRDTGWEAATIRSRVPEEPMAWALNSVELEPVQARKLRVILRPALPAATGVSELRIFEK